ncbi:MAG: hypothetical protein Q8L55_05100 [Phycisphaerales bacterium]|nr:hypothetical protein [Phycisphaerales bacterium]
MLQLLCAWAFALLGSRNGEFTQIGLSGYKEYGWSAFNWSPELSEVDRASLQRSTLQLIRADLGDEFIDVLPGDENSRHVTREITAGTGLTFERVFAGCFLREHRIDRIDLYAGWPFHSTRCSFPDGHFFWSLEPTGRELRALDWQDAWQIWVEVEDLPVWGQEGGCFGLSPAPVQLRPLPRRIRLWATIANTLLFGGFLWGVRFGPGMAFDAWRKHRTGCANCGYDICGLSRCPECGTPVTSAPSPPSSATAP